MNYLLLVYIFFQTSVNNLLSQHCERDDSAYEEANVHEKIADCKNNEDPFQCVAQLDILPANLLMNFGYAVGFLENAGRANFISPEALVLYDNCSKSLAYQMPHHFRTKLLKILDVKTYEHHCFSKDEICEMNRKFLYPFVCLCRTKCSEYLTDSFYTLTYAHQMLHLERNEVLKCSENGETDVPEVLFEKGRVFPAHGILSQRFCQHIPNPPRLTLKETVGENIVISVETGFYWP